MRDLFHNNTPDNFWLIKPQPPLDLWEEAIKVNLELLNLPVTITDVNELVEFILGEKLYGDDVWHLSPVAQLYYLIKPIISRSIIIKLRQLYHSPDNQNLTFIDDRYAKFLLGVRDYVMTNLDTPAEITPLWPDNRQFAFVLTHDIEEAQGQDAVLELADIDEQFGFRSAFYFVPERYPLDYDLIATLKERGFEVGIHGLKHDGKLFLSEKNFNKRVKKINDYLDQMGAVGFSSPLTHRNGLWLQQLNIEYDRSFFDKDNYEPMPGGVMSIWPYHLGKFIELPYTLPQDFTLTQIIGAQTPDIWIKKLKFIQKYHGMALLNSHPDYLKYKNTKEVYISFLEHVSKMDGYWHALPRDVARWWRSR